MESGGGGSDVFSCCTVVLYHVVAHFNNSHGSVTALAKTTLLDGIAVSIFLSL
jgi:hypothetical protein